MCLKDLTSIVDIKTSSRPAMIGSLTDGSTETFWESGDEDKNKTKNITINCVKGINARYVSIHVDNSRDLGVRKETYLWLVSSCQTFINDTVSFLSFSKKAFIWNFTNQTTYLYSQNNSSLKTD